jgi:hypothetical protein
MADQWLVSIEQHLLIVSTEVMAVLITLLVPWHIWKPHIRTEKGTQPYLFWELQALAHEQSSSPNPHGYSTPLKCVLLLHNKSSLPIPYFVLCLSSFSGSDKNWKYWVEVSLSLPETSPALTASNACTLCSLFASSQTQGFGHAGQVLYPKPHPHLFTSFCT